MYSVFLTVATFRVEHTYFEGEESPAGQYLTKKDGVAGERVSSRIFLNKRISRGKINKNCFEGETGIALPLLVQ